MPSLSKDLKVEMLRRMIRSRLFEEKAMSLYDEGQFPGSAHLSIGQEAGAVGACCALETSDYMIGTHRSHGHSVAKNADVRGLMAELLGKVTGVNKGRGGSMHLADKKVGSLGETSILGSGLPIACGAALASKINKTGQVVLVFYGDGSANEGAVHESMNIAAVWKLPVIFVLENNGVAVSTLAKDSSAVEDLCIRAAGYGMPGMKTDGQDPELAYEAVKLAVDRARANEGPYVVELKTYRFREHGEGAVFRVLAKKGYRDIEDHERWINERDPISTYPQKLISEGTVTVDEYEKIVKSEKERIEDAAAFALESPYPDPEDAYKGVYSSPIPQ
jgi:pyruvate dehydrogenase E1 component alpha subunit